MNICERLLWTCQLRNTVEVDSLNSFIWMENEEKTKKKILLFPEMGMKKKIFTWVAAKFFFNEFNWIFLKKVNT